MTSPRSLVRPTVLPDRTHGRGWLPNSDFSGGSQQGRRGALLSCYLGRRLINMLYYGGRVVSERGQRRRDLIPELPEQPTARPQRAHAARHRSPCSAALRHIVLGAPVIGFVQACRAAPETRAPRSRISTQGGRPRPPTRTNGGDRSDAPEVDVAAPRHRTSADDVLSYPRHDLARHDDIGCAFSRLRCSQRPRAGDPGRRNEGSQWMNVSHSLTAHVRRRARCRFATASRCRGVRCSSGSVGIAAE